MRLSRKTRRNSEKTTAAVATWCGIWNGSLSRFRFSLKISCGFFSSPVPYTTDETATENLKNKKEHKKRRAQYRSSYKQNPEKNAKWKKKKQIVDRQPTENTLHVTREYVCSFVPFFCLFCCKRLTHLYDGASFTDFSGIYFRHCRIVLHVERRSEYR